VAVQVLAGSVIPHRRARVRVPGGDLDVPQVDASIETDNESVTKLVASKIRRPSRPSMAISAKSQAFGDSRAVSSASNCRWVNPRVGDSAGTAGRRTCSAGECGMSPSMTQVR
jgi:hypothetical protein